MSLTISLVIYSYLLILKVRSNKSPCLTEYLEMLPKCCIIELTLWLTREKGLWQEIDSKFPVLKLFMYLLG